MSKLEELITGLHDLEQDLDGISDEMTFREIEIHGKAWYLLQLAEEILREDSR